MAATGQGDAGQAQGAESGEAGGFDASALQAQLAQTSTGVDELRSQFGQFVESAPWQPQSEPEPEAAPELDLSFLDDSYANPAIGDAERQAQQQALQGQIQGFVQQQLQQALAPVQEQQQQLRREQQARDLVGEFPEFNDADVAQKIAGPQGLAVQLANDLGAPQLAAEPGFWRLVHMADRAASNGNTEAGAEAPGAAHLEGGGGAGPGTGGQASIADQIFGSAGSRGAGVLPFG